MKTNVVTLPPNGYGREPADIANNLRAVAKDLEAGVYGDVDIVAMVITNAQGDTINVTLGHDCDVAKLVGMLVMGSLNACIQ